MHERVKREIEFLREKYPELQHGEVLDWVQILNVALPMNFYNLERSPIAFLIPAGYPNTGPDNFFVDGSLRLKTGEKPPNFNEGKKSGSGELELDGSWGWFSWHP